MNQRRTGGVANENKTNPVPAKIVRMDTKLPGIHINEKREAGACRKVGSTRIKAEKKRTEIRN